MSSQIYKKYNWQRASAKLALFTACVEGRRVEPSALLHALRHYALRAKIILADFNLAVSTQTAKPPNLIPRQMLYCISVPETTVLSCSILSVPTFFLLR